MRTSVKPHVLDPISGKKRTATMALAHYAENIRHFILERPDKCKEPYKAIENSVKKIERI